MDHGDIAWAGNRCMFCGRSRIPNRFYRAFMTPNALIEWGADCCGDTEQLGEPQPDGSVIWRTPNAVYYGAGGAVRPPARDEADRWRETYRDTGAARYACTGRMER